MYHRQIQSMIYQEMDVKADYNICEFRTDSNLLLHNLVIKGQLDGKSEKLNYIRAIEQYLDESDEHELNKKDSYGRTALHIAVQRRNVEAIAALLMCGADVNIADVYNKTPFTYCLETFDMRNYKCNQMFYTLFGHVHKLIVIGLFVSEETKQCYQKARSHHVFNEKQLQLSYAVELDKMEDVIIGPNTSLRDVLYEGAHEIAISMIKRRTLEEVLTASDFNDEFPKLCCLLKLQYRRGVTRRKLMRPVKEALLILLGISLPEPCAEGIIKLLNDDDLMNLIKAGLGDEIY